MYNSSQVNIVISSPSKHTIQTSRYIFDTFFFFIMPSSVRHLNSAIKMGDQYKSLILAQVLNMS